MIDGTLLILGTLINKTDTKRSISLYNSQAVEGVGCWLILVSVVDDVVWAGWEHLAADQARWEAEESDQGDSAFHFYGVSVVAEWTMERFWSEDI